MIYRQRDACGAACNQLGRHQEQGNGQYVDEISQNSGEYGFEHLPHEYCTSCIDLLFISDWQSCKTFRKKQENYETIFLFCPVTYGFANLALVFSFQAATIDTEHFVF